MLTRSIEIEYFSHYRREFIRRGYYYISEREYTRATVTSSVTWDHKKLARVVYLGLKSKDPAQNNFYVLIKGGISTRVLLDLSTGKLISEFEEKRVLRFPRKRSM